MPFKRGDIVEVQGLAEANGAIAIVVHYADVGNVYLNWITPVPKWTWKHIDPKCDIYVAAHYLTKLTEADL